MQIEAGSKSLSGPFGLGSSLCADGVRVADKTGGHVAQNVEAVRVVVEAEKDVEQKELTDRVSYVEELGRDEHAREIGAVGFALAAQRLVESWPRGHARRQTGGRRGAEAALGSLGLVANRVEVKRIGQVEKRTSPLLELLHGHVVESRVGHVQHVDARLFAEKTVEEARQQEEKRHAQQYHGHPLIVLDRALGFVGHARGLLAKRHKICVAYPAVHIDVVLILG